MGKLVFVLVLLWPVGVVADFAAGEVAYQRGDYATAMREFRLLAEQGDAFSQYALGIGYARGLGVPEDFVQAYAWFKLAAAQGEENAAQRKDSTHESMTPAQIAEAQKLSRELCAKIPGCAK